MSKGKSPNLSDKTEQWDFTHKPLLDMCPAGGSLSDGVNIGIMDKWKPDPNSIVGFNKRILDLLDTIAGLVEKETTIFVTSTQWGQIAAAVKMMHPEAKINPSNFNRLKILKLTVVNSRSEDQAAVDAAEEAMAKATDFQNIRARKRTG